MGDEFKLDPDLFLPKAEQLTPRFESIPAGVRFLVLMERPGRIQALTPATAGTIFVYPGGDPGATAQMIPWTTGEAALNGKGRWWVAHSGVGTEVFRVVFDGFPGDSSGSAPPTAAPYNLQQINGTSQTALDLTGKYVPPTLGARIPVTVVGAADSGVIIAANTSRRFLYLTNGGATTIGVDASAAAMTGVADGFIVLPPGSGYVFGPASEPPPTGAIRAYGSGAGGALYAREAT